MNHRICLAAATAAALTAIPTTAAHADRLPTDEGGDTRSCVTYDEFSVTHLGMSRGQIKRVFDTDGHRISNRIMDGMAGTVQTQPGTEVALPERRATRLYFGCIDADNPNGADIYVQYNQRTDRATATLWI